MIFDFSLSEILVVIFAINFRYPLWKEITSLILRSPFLRSSVKSSLLLSFTSRKFSKSAVYRPSPDNWVIDRIKTLLNLIPSLIHKDKKNSGKSVIFATANKVLIDKCNTKTGITHGKHSTTSGAIIMYFNALFMFSALQITIIKRTNAIDGVAAIKNSAVNGSIIA
ncbi:hypothetical protein TNCT_702411 [Trichonephila clavata]|uniref:Uncharacterized protein n=1 Tax=Trichonephila clavata TaxID=2740835 RepID=A0A8X6HM11_TRICU|nr:hypothetical protein TNCT_702411 [Trichonephila clavata]